MMLLQKHEVKHYGFIKLNSGPAVGTVSYQDRKSIPALDLKLRGLCAICGDVVFHRVLTHSMIGLCTKHFTMLFSVPPNRQEKQPKVVRADPRNDIVRDWVLTRTMDFPLKFKGSRTALFHGGKFALSEIFISIYATTNGSRYLSFTIVTKDRNMDRSIYSVQPLGDPFPTNTDEELRKSLALAITDILDAHNFSNSDNVIARTHLMNVGTKFLAFLKS